MTTAPIDIDFVIPDTLSSGHANVGRQHILNLTAEYPRIACQVLHYTATAEEIEKSGVSSEDWLIFNAASATYICITPIEKLKDESLTKLITIIDEFRATKAFPDPDGPGRVDIALPTPITGVTRLVYNVHNRHRALRNIGAAFSNLPKIALLVPMSLKGIRGPNIPIMSTLAPALQQTFAHCRMQRGLYLGIDANEKFPVGLINSISNRFNRSIKCPHERTIEFPPSWRKDRNMARMYNELFRYAMMDGYDFAVVLQDDARPETATWDKILGSFLCGNPLAVGAYSMQDRYNTGRLNNIMISRTHFDIFGYLFNPRCTDTSLWTQKVLGTYAKVVTRTKVTNVVRNRRFSNGTDHIKSYYGKEYASVYEPDRKHFEEVLAGHSRAS